MDISRSDNDSILKISSALSGGQMKSFVRLFVPKNYYRLTILQVNRLSWHCEAAFTEAGLMSGVDFETPTSPKD